jgi:type VI secretion system secreted protein Hcp
MPSLKSQLSGHGHGGGADVFLHLQTRRAGKVKGEAANEGHVDDIVVSGWHWGLSASSALGSTQATSRRSYSALTVVKHIDQATTALMAALATNDEVKEARLTMRRAGGSQEDYFTIKLQSARITSLQHECGDDGSTRETLTIAFTRVDVEYRPQRSTGLRAGATSFSDELPQNE